MEDLFQLDGRTVRAVTGQRVGTGDMASGDSFFVTGDGPSGETARRDGRQQGPCIFGTEQSRQFSRAEEDANWADARWTDRTDCQILTTIERRGQRLQREVETTMT